MKTQEKRQLLITMALPYANGDIHLGHLVEAIQADLWTRFQKMNGHECYFICGSDAHGTATMLSAEEEGITPEQLINRIKQSHHRDFETFFIDFDNFYTTHSLENENLSSHIYKKLKANNDITTQKIYQAFDPKKKLFLSDRFIQGTCPRCLTEDQYGDNCEACGATYKPTDLIDPKSKISGVKPIEKPSLHYFFELGHYESLLKDWVNPKHFQSHVIKKLQEWFKEGLKKWDISRDAPYFGFEIPDAPGKYFYVWLDAPIGYMASFKNLCDRRKNLNFEHFWNSDSKTELHHFIGKDIVYFHSFFWPAMLYGSGYRMPTSILVHGFLTVNGKKMSKSRGTFITAKHFAKKLDPEYLRYYFAGKLTGQVEDIDLNFRDIKARINSDLVGKYINLASRCSSFIKKKFDLTLCGYLHDPELFSHFVQAGRSIAQAYDALNTNYAVREIMVLADHANQYINHRQPWVLVKVEKKAREVHSICTQGLNLFRVLSIYLKPILPKTVKRVEDFLKVEPFQWKDSEIPLLNHSIESFNPLMQRITEEELELLNN